MQQSVKLRSLFSCEQARTGMRFDWRAISGPALTAATALTAVLSIFISSWPFSNPAALFVCIVAFAGSSQRPCLGPGQRRRGGRRARAVFPQPPRRPGYEATDLVRLSLLALTAAGTAVITGLLRKRLMDAFALGTQAYATAARLSAALDQVDIGIVLLDSDTRAEFINRAFRDYFALPDQKADSKPPFIALMYHGRDTGAYELPEEELSAFIAERTKMMRAGDRPDQHQARDGKVLRFSCAALPDGGRMLSYTPVTDLVRYTDDPAKVTTTRRCATAADRGRTRRGIAT